MVSAGMIDFLIAVLPIITLIGALIGVIWGARKNKKYLTGFILMILGVGVHYYGLLGIVEPWSGIAISFLGGGGLILLGLLILFVTLIYSKLIGEKSIKET